MPLLKGKVVRGESPVEGAYVRLNGPSGDFLSERRTRESGSFRFHLTPGSWTLKWWLPGGEQGSKDVVLGDADTDEVISL